MSHGLNVREAIAQAYVAEAAWIDELGRIHPRLVNARYLPEGKGEPGTLLAALYSFHRDASDAMHAAFAAARQADAKARADASLCGRVAYEASLAACPTYHDGNERKPWAALGEVERWSWERQPRA